MKQLFFLVIISISLSQYTSETNQKAMSKLAFLIGEWQGSAWKLSRDGKSEIPVQTEKVEWKLDKTAILVEGKGTDLAGNVVHHALGMISWNQQKNYYEFRSILADGHGSNSIAKFNDDGKFQWFLEIPSGQIIYTVEEIDGKWHEVGEMEIQGSNRRIFEMTLSKK